MKKSFRIVTLLMAIAMILALCACGGGNNSNTPGTNNNPSTTDNSSDGANQGTESGKDTLNFAFLSESQPLDPAKTSDTYTYIVLSQVFDTLVRIESDGSIAPWLATEWDVSADGKEVVFTIRDGVTFHNGDPLTIEDVVYSLNRAIVSPQAAKFTAVFEKAEKVDDSSVRITLPNPYAPFLYSIGNPCMGIVNEKAVEEFGDDFGRNPVGTGAYKYVDWVSGEKMTLTRNDEWWNTPAAIKDVTLRFISDASTAAISLEKGEIDVLYKSSTNDRTALMENSGLTYYEWDSAMLLHMSFNNGEESIFNDRKLREAVSYAIDPEAILIGGLDGVGGVHHFMTAPSAFGYNPDFRQNEYNPELAKTLMEEAGYPTDGSITVRIRSNETSTYAGPCEIIQEQLRQIGITATLDKLERATYLDEVTRNFDYDISVYAITALIPDADYTMYTRLHSNMLGAGNNFSQTNIPELDDVLDRARVSQDQEERMALYTEAAQITKDYATVIPICISKYNIVANKDLKGVSEHAIDLHHMYEYAW